MRKKGDTFPSTAKSATIRRRRDWDETAVVGLRFADRHRLWHCLLYLVSRAMEHHFYADIVFDLYDEQPENSAIATEPIAKFSALESE